MKIDRDIVVICNKISNNINTIDRLEHGLVAQNVVDTLRDLAEHVAIKIFAKGVEMENTPEINKQAMQCCKSISKFNFLSKFHSLLQISVSHYTPDPDGAIRLMKKYYEYLMKIRHFLESEYNMKVLENLEKYPIKQDPSLLEYYQKIADKIMTGSDEASQQFYEGRCYIHKMKPFYVGKMVFYEVSFTIASDNVSKYDRFIGFTSIQDMVKNYAVKFSLRTDSIEVSGQQIQVLIIDNYEVSVRPCELKNFGRIVGIEHNFRSDSQDYANLMRYIYKSGMTLDQVVALPEIEYSKMKRDVEPPRATSCILEIFDVSRNIIMKNLPGANVLKYLLYNLRNRVVKHQLSDDKCRKLSWLNLQFGCISFDEMPFNTSLIQHNPAFFDLFFCLDSTGREHEFLARKLRNNAEIEGRIFTARDELEEYSNINQLIEKYNGIVYHGHTERHIKCFHNYLYINGYVDKPAYIIKKLSELTICCYEDYSVLAEEWLMFSEYEIDCDEKRNIFLKAFAETSAFFLYGSAGTGKTTFMDYLSAFLEGKRQVFLANTNAAVENLKSKISSLNADFYTIRTFLNREHYKKPYSVIFIDECSTVSNDDMYKILDNSDSDFIVLVGDILQIESIRFGNWFDVVRFFLPDSLIFVLETPYRSKNSQLLEVWKKVRNIEDDIKEYLIRNEYTTSLDEFKFEHSDSDEIVLCLNYDDLYGINNINRFLQNSNPNEEVAWGLYTYKVGDPILFNETKRFHPLIHNNAKGRIVDIQIQDEDIQFDILLEQRLSKIAGFGLPYQILNEDGTSNSTIRFSVKKHQNSDQDEENLDHIMPFQVAYAISIHKAQGLEYDSVKVVITEEVDEQITHNIFYTAITRAREKLKIYWSPDTEKKILARFKKKETFKDACLVAAIKGLNKPKFSKY